VGRLYAGRQAASGGRMSQSPRRVTDGRDEGVLDDTIDLLTCREETAKLPAAAARHRELRHRVERLREEQRINREREGLLPCPTCGAWVKLAQKEVQGLQCPACGARTDFPTLHAVTGLWKLHLVFLALFTALAVVLGSVALSPAVPMMPRCIAGVATIPFIVLSLPYWQYGAQQIVRLLRTRTGR
jgi:hypothetical protein